MMSDGHLHPWQRESVCEVCPAQTMGLGAFDVTDRPSAGRYDAALGYRVEPSTGVAVCVHPYRVGLPAGRYASRGDAIEVPATAPVPGAEDLVLPIDPVDLEAWLVATLRTAPPAGMASALEQAETIASRRFPTKLIVAALRRVLSVELVNDAR